MQWQRVVEGAIMKSEEPVAVVGLGCRLAGGIGSPVELWDFLVQGRRSADKIPVSRWDPTDGPSSTSLPGMPKRGSFLEDVAGFDAAFFGMSPREATSVDPQQRILLEVVWEALEHAGIPAECLEGSDTGVFVAGSSFDYGQRLQSDPALMEPWALHGSMLYALANRVSYTLDLRGPSLVVDTACASSLTALHLACQSLWRQESSLALACGVNVMAAPGAFICRGRSAAESAGPRCRVSVPAGLSRTRCSNRPP
jgi:acyl transferase domain-containing protein